MIFILLLTLRNDKGKNVLTKYLYLISPIDNYCDL